ncbi:MAG: sigma-70 family RNA polymerase sigma factor [Solirubrobacterales bacterium]
MTVIDRPWLFKDDDGMPRFKGAAWYGDGQRVSSYWPGPRRNKEFEAHDDQTKVLIRTIDELYRLPESNTVVPLLEDWKWRDKMETAADKQRYLEPMLDRVSRAPEKHRGELIFLLLVCESVRRGVAGELLRAHTGLEGPSSTPSAHRRMETRRVHEIERERLMDVTRQAVLEAIYRYPSPPPKHFFGWLRETVAHFTLDFLREELAEIETNSLRAREAEAMQAFLAGFDDVDPPPLGEEGGFKKFYFGARAFYGTVGEYLNLREVRSVCRTAVDRLPRRQREVIDGEFYDGLTPEEIANKQGIERSTVYNSKAHALRNLNNDDCFFMALCGMRLVRDSERKAQLMEKYPEGRLKDGRRIVHIDEAA